MRYVLEGKLTRREFVAGSVAAASVTASGLAFAGASTVRTGSSGGEGSGEAAPFIWVFASDPRASESGYAVLPG